MMSIFLKTFELFHLFNPTWTYFLKACQFNKTPSKHDGICWAPSSEFIKQQIIYRKLFYFLFHKLLSWIHRRQFSPSIITFCDPLQQIFRSAKRTFFFFTFNLIFRLRRLTREAVIKFKNIWICPEEFSTNFCTHFVVEFFCLHFKRVHTSPSTLQIILHVCV